MTISLELFPAEQFCYGGYQVIFPIFVMLKGTVVQFVGGAEPVVMMLALGEPESEEVSVPFEGIIVSLEVELTTLLLGGAGLLPSWTC